MSRMNLLITILVLFTPVKTFACSCTVGATFEQSVSGITFLAAIEVLSVDTINVKYNSTSERVSSYAKYTARLTDRIKGEFLSDTIAVYTTISDCGYVFKPGLKYILFAELDYFKEPGEDFLHGQKALWTNTCTYTSPFGDGIVRSIRKALKPPGADKVVPVKLY